MPEREYPERIPRDMRLEHVLDPLRPRTIPLAEPVHVKAGDVAWIGVDLEANTARVLRVEHPAPPEPSNRWAAFTDDELETLASGMKWEWRQSGGALDPLVDEIADEFERRRQA